MRIKRSRLLAAAAAAAALALAGPARAIADVYPDDEDKRLYLLKYNSDGSLVCAPTCKSPTGFCC